MTPGGFNRQITENGENIFIATMEQTTDRWRKIDAWLTVAEKESGQWLEWHYIGGKAIIWCDGDKEKARVSIERHAPPDLQSLNWKGDMTGGVPINYTTGEVG